MASIHIRDLTKSFATPNGEETKSLVLDSISLDIAEGDFVSFFGPNGCGKTTLLLSIAGLLAPDAGTVNVETGASRAPRLGFIFQNFRESLYPWLSNVDNVAFPLELHGVSKGESRKRARALLDHLEIKIAHNGYPYQLSGGESQLLAIARALIFEADALLMDEPFASLDYTTRFLARDRVQNIWTKTKATTVMVSHGIEEAIYLANKVVIFSKRPMHVLDVIDVKLPRPRTPDLLEDGQFFRIQSHAVRVFKDAISS